VRLYIIEFVGSVKIEWPTCDPPKGSFFSEPRLDQRETLNSKNTGRARVSSHLANPKHLSKWALAFVLLHGTSSAFVEPRAQRNTKKKKKD